MSSAAAFIPTFTAITLLLGGLNGLSIQLTLVGILAITLHTAATPTDFNPYPNFDDYHPTQPPLRDYVLVFGLVSLMLIALFSRIHPLVSILVLLHLNHILTLVPSLPALVLGARYLEGTASVPWVVWTGSTSSQHASWSVRPSGPGSFFSYFLNMGPLLTPLQDTTIDHGVRSVPHLPRSSPSPSHTFTSQWTATASTLVAESPAPVTPQAAGHREVTDSSETAALKARVSQLETALEELRRRMDILSAGEKGM